MKQLSKTATKLLIRKASKPILFEAEFKEYRADKKEYKVEFPGEIEDNKPETYDDFCQSSWWEEVLNDAQYSDGVPDGEILAARKMCRLLGLKYKMHKDIIEFKGKDY